ncbi:unnamed protein product [Didymodactylos carnosus]|nr:unnamed protein product [Didymodactylos carnosus]CAF4101088.1 unnamed protein product [Didymodactylos carnosus]
MFRLWNYRPNNDYGHTLDRAHKRYIPYALVNDQRTTHWRVSLCQRQQCISTNKCHVLMYHSSNVHFRPGNRGNNHDTIQDNHVGRPSDTFDNQIVIGFHQTSKEAAYSIAKNGFSVSTQGMMGRGVYFALSINHTEFKANQYGAIICATVNLGKVLRIERRQVPVDIDVRAQNYDSVYCDHPNGYDEFCVRRPQRIESWIITVNQSLDIQPGLDQAVVHDPFEGDVYEGCM